MTRKQGLLTALLAVVMLLFYGSVSDIWLRGDSALFAAWDHLWGISPVVPPGRWYAHTPLPFFDLAGVLSWRDCYLRGLDVMAFNPCDPQGRLSNYSPFFYLLPIGGIRDTMWIGLLLDGVFLAVLVWLLRPATWIQFAVSALAAISHVTAYAVERANIDILMFLFLLGTLALWRRGRSWAAYSLVLASAALKFYPLVLMLLAARERPRKLLSAACISILLVALFVTGFWRELVRIPSLMHHLSFFDDEFGASLFAVGVQDQLGLPRFVRPLLELPILAIGIWGAFRLEVRFRSALSAINWTVPHMSLMLGGTITMLACFCLTDNNDYRAIFLLATLPGLFALRRQTGDRSLARLLAWAIAAMVFCLYSEIIRLQMDNVEILIYGSDPGDVVHELPLVVCFVLREAIWWLLMTLFGTLLLAFLRQAPLLRLLYSRPGSVSA